MANMNPTINKRLMRAHEELRASRLILDRVKEHKDNLKNGEKVLELSEQRHVKATLTYAQVVKQAMANGYTEEDINRIVGIGEKLP